MLVTQSNSRAILPIRKQIRGAPPFNQKNDQVVTILPAGMAKQDGVSPMPLPLADSGVGPVPIGLAIDRPVGTGPTKICDTN